MASIKGAQAAREMEQRQADARQKAGLLGGMQRQLEGWQPVQQLQQEQFQPTVQDGPLKEYEGIKQAVSNRANAAKQGNLEAMQRRFAASGNLNSGAAMKAQDVAAREADQQAADQLANVDLQAASELQRRKEGDLARKDAVAGRNLQRDMTNQSMAFQDKMSKFDAGSKLAQLDIGFDQFALQRGESEFNKAQARHSARNSGGLFGGGGFLGLGIGVDQDSDVGY